MLHIGSTRLGLLQKATVFIALLISALTSYSQVINVAPGVVNFDDFDGQCSLYEAAQVIIDGNNAVEPNCNAPIAGLNTVSLAPGSVYVLDTDHDLDFLYVPEGNFNLDGNGSTIMRAPAAPEITLIRPGFGMPSTISNLTLADSGTATALSVITSNVTVDSVNFINNGTGIFFGNAAGFELLNSTFSGTGTETGLANMEGNATITNSTFSGLATAISIENADFTLNNNTIVNNGIGINAMGAGSGSISNSIVANNATADCIGGAGNQLQSQGFNISSDPGNPCSFVPANNDLINTDPMLDPLANNGGPTDTHLPQPGSPAIDNGDNASCAPNDQRGVARPQDGDGDLNSDCDIGSVEALPPPPVMPVVINVDPGLVNFNAADGLCSLYEAAQVIIDGNNLIEPGCEAPSTALDIISLAPGSVYMLDTDPNGDSVYMPVASFDLQGNGATIMRAPAAPEFVFMEFAFGNQNAISNVRLANAGNAGVAIDILASGVLVEGVDFVNNGTGISMLTVVGNVIQNSTFSGSGTETGIVAIEAGYSIINTTFSGLGTALDISSSDYVLNNVTMANNMIGIDAVAIMASSIINSILANLAGTNCVGETPVSQGFNIDSANTCNFANVGDMSGVDPLLGPLLNNGGFTPTHLPQTGSPAIDNGMNGPACPPDDQRGVLRPQDGNGDTINDCDIGAVEVMLTEADLAVTNMVDMPTANNGDILTYTFIVDNNGPAAIDGQNGAFSVEFTPDLINVSWTCVGADGASCTAMGTGNTIDENPVMPANSSIMFTVMAEIGPAAVDDILVEASVAVFNGLIDPVPGNDFATSIVMIGAPNFDLEITKTDNEIEVLPGDPLVYDIVVTHLGDTLTNATVTDTFPVGLTNITWTCMASVKLSVCPPTGNGDINTPVIIEAGSSLTFTVNAMVDPAFSGLISNTAEVLVDLPDVDPNPANNIATDMTTVTPINADLAITKTDNQMTANPGDMLMYDITVQHVGDAPVQNATVIDNFPGGLNNIAWTCIAQAGANCPNNGTGNIDVQVGLNPGTSLTFFVNAEIDPAFLGTLTNTATVTVNAPDVDPNPVNNTATDITEVVELVVDLAIDKTVDIALAEPGDTITYTITVDHLPPITQVNPDGPVVPVEALVTDVFSTQLDNVAWTCISNGGGECLPEGIGNINESVMLPVDGRVVFTITATVAAGATGDIVNQATVMPLNAVDNQQANNTSPAVVTTVDQAFDLAITKTDGQMSSTPGAAINYVIIATNNSSTEVDGARVIDMFPEALVDPSWTCTAGLGAACGAASGNGNIDELVNFAGSSFVRFEVSATIDENFEGTLENEASVSAPAGIDDPAPQNNQATDTTAVSGQADLSVTKSGPVTAANGSNVMFDVTVNNAGAVAVTDIMLVDAWSDGLSLLDIESGAFNCDDPLGSMVMCQLDELAAGASVVLQFSFAVDAAIGDTLTNQVAINAATGDPNNANNMASVMTMVAGTLDILPTNGQLPDAAVGMTYSAIFTAVGGVDPINMTVSSVPEGFNVQIDDRMLTIAGTPTSAGINLFTVQATDAVNQSFARDYSLQVVTGLIFEPEALPVANTDESYLAQIVPANGVPPFIVDISNLPNGLINTNGVIQGQPQSVGEFVLSVSAMDSQGNTGTRDYDLTVESGLQLPAQSVPPAILNLSYGEQLISTGGLGPNTWSGGGGLPAGLNLANTGFISGEPQAVGEFNFNATVTDANGLQSTRQFTITVEPDGLVQREIRFPNGLVGVPYVTPTAVAGGEQPYTCTLLNSTLPPGLVLNGCNAGIDGTPTQGGSFNFVLAIEDNQDPSETLITPARISIAETTPIPIADPPDPGFDPPIDVPVPEFGDGSPADGFADESLQAIASDAFGNRYLAGFGWNGNDYDIRVLKYSARGELEWEQRFDSGDQDYAYAIDIAPLDQQMFVGGYSLRGSEYVATLLRYDLSGTLQQTIFDDINSQVKAYYDLQADMTGVYAVGESYNGSNFDGLVVRYDMNGNRLFEALRDTGASETAYAAELTDCDNDGVCSVVFGGFEGDQNPSGWLAGIGPAGGSVQMIAQLPDAIFDLKQFSNGDWLVGSTSNSDDWMLRRLNTNGTTIWSTTVAQGERLRSVAIDAGGFVLASGSATDSGGSDGLLVVLDGAQGQSLDSLTIDNGLREVLTGSLIGPEGLLSLVGERGDLETNRFLFLNIDTGKAF